MLFLPITGQNIKRESGRKVQLGNINAAKVGPLLFYEGVSDVRKTLIFFFFPF